MGFSTTFAYGTDMEENSWLFRHTHFKKDSENRDREGKKHSPELKPFNLLKSRQLSDLITLEVSGGGGRFNAQKLTDVTVKERTRDSHWKLETERLTRENKQVLVTAKPGTASNIQTHVQVVYGMSSACIFKTRWFSRISIFAKRKG